MEAEAQSVQEGKDSLTSKPESLENDKKRLEYLQANLDVLKQDFLRGAIGVTAYHNRAFPLQAKIHQAEGRT